MNIVVIVQARTGSTRFPGKILKEVCGHTLLEHQLTRIQAAKFPTNIVVATTMLPNDNMIVDICNQAGVASYRGHSSDLLDRHYKAALKYEADVVLKIPSDCPLIDPSVIDRVLEYYLDNRSKYDYVSNLHPATYPDGNDVEVMPIKILETAWKYAEKSFELEHTTPYIWDNPGRFRIGNVTWESGLDYSMSHRFTIDYPEDYDFIKAIYQELYEPNKIFHLKDILNLLNTKPELMKINEKYDGVNWYRKHINELNTIDRLSTNPAYC